MFVKFFEVKLFDECQKLSRTLPELILLKLDKSIWRGLVFAAVKASKTQKDEDYAVSLLQLAAEYEIYPHLLVMVFSIKVFIVRLVSLMAGVIINKIILSENNHANKNKLL